MIVKIYVDLVLLLNFGFDLVLLFGVAIILRRQTTLSRLLLGALVGSMTIVFYFNGLSVNVLVLIVLSPIIIYSYVKQGLLLRNHYSNYYNVDIYFKNGEVIPVTAFMDTGNKLEDPYKKRPIILINKDLIIIDYNKEGVVLVPYKAINHHGLLK